MRTGTKPVSFLPGKAVNHYEKNHYLYDIVSFFMILIMVFIAEINGNTVPVRFKPTVVGRNIVN